MPQRSALSVQPAVLPAGPDPLVKPAAGLYDGVLVQLRRMIFEAELAPESRIVERVLCERLKVSRTPLREAFKVLAAEGLVELLPNCGARVSRFREQDVRDAMEVMGAVEGLAGELAATRASEDVIAELQAMHYQMRAHYLRRELPQYFRLNQAIHRRIVEAAGNSLLTAHYDSLSIRVARARYLANRLDEDRWAKAMREHEAMLDCMIRRAGAELRDLLTHHIMNKLSSLLEHFPGAEPAPAAALPAAKAKQASKAKPLAQAKQASKAKPLAQPKQASKAEQLAQAKQTAKTSQTARTKQAAKTKQTAKTEQTAKTKQTSKVEQPAKANQARDAEPAAVAKQAGKQKLTGRGSKALGPRLQGPASRASKRSA